MIKTRKPQGSLLLKLMVLAVLLLPATLPCGGARAQGLGDRPSVNDFIDQTGELLDWAGEIVHESGSLQARRILNEATRLHERSVSMVDSGPRDTALAMSRRARAATFLATRLAREALVFSERYQILEERYADRRLELMDRARAAGRKQALDLLERAARQDMRAREQFNQGDSRQACRILEQVEMLQNRAAGLLGVGPDREHLDQMLDRTEDLLERAQDFTGPDASPQTLSLLKDAEVALRKARDFQAKGMAARALKAGRLARKLADQALLAPPGGNDPVAAAARQIERWDRRVANLSESPDGSVAPARAELLSRSRKFRDRARALLEDGKPLMALRQIKLAHDLLDQVERRTR